MTSEPKQITGMESAYDYAKSLKTYSNISVSSGLIVDMRNAIISQHEEIERLREQTEYLESQINNALAKNSMSYLLGEPPKGDDNE